MNSKFFVLYIFFFISCSAKKEPVNSPKASEKSDSTTSSSAIHTVVVIDSGFDLKHNAFDGKIIESETYTIHCDEFGASDSMSAEEFIDSIKSMHAECELKNGLPYFSKSPSLSNITDKQKQRWNTSVFNKSVDDEIYEEYFDAISGYDGNYSYHGTHVAGLIAYKNENVKLILIEKPDDKVFFTLTNENESCPSNSSLSHEVSLLKQEKVADAYIKMPLSPMERKLHKIYDKYKPTFINYSHSSRAYETIKKIYREKGCNEAEISAWIELWINYNQIRFDLRRSREDYHLGTGEFSLHIQNIIIMQSAGNEFDEINDAKDQKECIEDVYGNKSTVLIGGMTDARKISEVSNFGSCVYNYTLGSNVIVPTVDNMYTVKDGSSFATPLAVRYMTQNYNSNLGKKAFLNALLELPIIEWPKELSYGQ